MFAATLRRKGWSLVTFELAANTFSWKQGRAVQTAAVQQVSSSNTVVLNCFQAIWSHRYWWTIHWHLSKSIFLTTVATFCKDEPKMKFYNSPTFEVGEGRTPHDVPSAALFTQAAKASIRSLQPSAPFSATLQNKQTNRNEITSEQCWLFSKI